MRKISKILFCILCINFLGQAIQTNAVVQGEQEVPLSTEEKTYTVEEYRQQKNEEVIITKAPRLAASTYGETQIINAIITGLRNKQREINLTPYVSYMTDKKYAANLYFKALDIFPELFYVSATDVGIISPPYSSTGAILSYSLEIEYTVDISKIDGMMKQYTDMLTKVKTEYTNVLYGDLKNEYIIHDYILENCVYGVKDEAPSLAHTAYGVLVDKVAVCDGYAKAAKALLNGCGIESGVVTNTKGDHAWNYVKISEVYYHLDLTWDDSKYNSNDLQYFNLSDAEIRTVESHTFPSGVYPECTSNEFDFLRKGYPWEGYFPKRVGDKLYYTEGVQGDLRSMDLKGASDVLVYSKLKFSDFEGYKSKLYNYDYIQNTETGQFLSFIESYNLVSKKLKIEYVIGKKIEYIYKENSDLYIKTSDGNIDIISIDMKEDVNIDGVIDILDVADAAKSYNKIKGSIGYSSIKDVNRDGIIDIYDICKISMEI